MNSDSAVNVIAVDIADLNIEPPRQPRHLLKLPPEIRIKIYSLIFAVKDPILLRVSKDGRLYQPAVDDMRAHRENQKVSVPARFLQTCSQVYHEATAFLFCHNTIEILDVDTNYLRQTRLTYSTRMLMTKIDFLNRTNERLNLSAIGDCFPSLRNLQIHTQGTGASLLILAYELSKSLPCSNFRVWPTLELHIQVPRSEAAIKEFKQELDSNDWYRLGKNAKNTAKIKKLFQNSATFRLDEFEPYAQPACKLGSEMPECSTITIHGGLLREYTRALTKYESSYGDCKFEFVREEPVPDTKDKKECTRLIYVWKRKDAAVAAAVRGKDLENTAALMRQWVPSLSSEFVKAMADAGL